MISAANTPAQANPSADTIDKMFRLLYKQPYFTEMLRLFFDDANDRDEFKQYISEQLLMKNHQKMLDLYNSGQMKFFLSRIFTNNVKSCSSDWHRHYRNPNFLLTDFQDPTIRHPKDEPNILMENNHLPFLNTPSPEFSIKLAIESAINGISINKPRLAPYMRLFRMHFYDKKSISRISRETNVSYKAISVNLRTIRELIKLELIAQNIQPNHND